MYEVELKVRADHGRVRDRLVERDAEALGTVEQVDTYYDHPLRDFGETDEALRIRRELADDGTTSVLTYKGPLVEAASKTREEVETAVDDGAATASILEAVGFEPVETVEKTRERYRTGGYTVTLDTVDGLGEFVEVETEAESGSVDPAREGAATLLESLGLDPDAQIRTSYLGLLLKEP